MDGWPLTFFNDCDTLDYCEYCRSPDGRIGSLETWRRYGRRNPRFIEPGTHPGMFSS
ncbi:DUF7693 family protein [Pseudomonas sp. Hz4]